MNDTNAEKFKMASLVEQLLQHRLSARTGDIPVLKAYPRHELRADWGLDDIDFARPHCEEEVSRFIEKYLKYSTALSHPGFIAHQTSLPTLEAAAADFINGMLNNGMAVYEMGPAGVVAENFVIEWLNSKTGWNQGGGVLVHGGSIANLTALLTARAVGDPGTWMNGIDKSVVFLAADSSHYSVARAIGIMGYGSGSLVKLETDELGRIDVAKMKQVVANLENKGNKIGALTCNTCATATGIYDPLAEIGAFCRDRNIWLHVDGAHGASVLLSRKHRHLMDGLEYADSLVWDMHKMMRTTNLCAALLFRNSSHIGAAFQQQASYLEADADEGRDDMYLKSIECTKAPIGFRFLFGLFVNGEKALTEFIDHTFEAAKSFYKLIQERSPFTSPFPPESNILLFRYKQGDELQEYIYYALIKTGRFYISKTRFNEKTYLRLTVMNPLTDVATVTQLLNLIEELAEARLS